MIDIFEHIYNNDIESVKKLIESVNNIDIKDSHGFTPLHDAVYYGYLDIVKYLIKSGANVNEKTKNNRNCLHILFQRKYGYNYIIMNKKDDFKIIETLIKNGADITIENNFGKTPLDYIINENDKIEISNYIRLIKLKKIYNK